MKNTRTKKSEVFTETKALKRYKRKTLSLDDINWLNRADQIQKYKNKK